MTDIAGATCPRVMGHYTANRAIAALPIYLLGARKHVSRKPRRQKTVSTHVDCKSLVELSLDGSVTLAAGETKQVASCGMLHSSYDMPICKLCHSEAELRDSHIIPEFMYKSLYDATHRAASVSIDGKAREMVLQKGLREKLLCQECETELSKLERYAAAVIRAILPKLHEAPAGTEVSQPAEYRPLKLFQLSLLWRAAVARHSNFRGADLGQLEPVVRSMLQREEPGPVTAFPCFAVAPLRVQDFRGTMGPTKQGVLNGVPVAHFLMLGIQWYHLLTEDLGSLPERMSASVTHRGLTITVGDHTVEESVRKIADEIYGRKPGGA